MEQAEESAKSLNKAMKGFGTDETRLIKEIVGQSNGQRQLIKEKYLALYGKVNLFENAKIFVSRK